MNIYSFLYLTDKNNPNLKSQIFKNNIQIYYNNAINLFYSLNSVKKGIKFTLLTNNKSYLLKNFNKPKKFEIKQIRFNTYVPNSINFYSSHFKFDVFKYLGNLKKYSVLIDLDVVLINKDRFKKLLEYESKNTVCLYNRTKETIESYRYSKIKSDIEFLAGKKINKIKWFGGEYISGSPLFFNNLHLQCLKFQRKYFLNYKKFFHNGDEMITNVFFNISPNLKFEDMGKNKIIYRFWNNNTFHKQKNFKSIKNFMFLHLPADKNTLSYVPFKYMKQSEFLRYYEKKSQGNLRKTSLYLKRKFREFIKI